MSFAVLLSDLLVRLACGSFLLLAAASLAVLVIREPARRIRVIQWSLAGLLALPALLLVPGYPRLAVMPLAAQRQNVEQQAPPAPLAQTPVLSESPAAAEPVATMPWPAPPLDESVEHPLPPAPAEPLELVPVAPPFEAASAPNWPENVLLESAAPIEVAPDSPPIATSEVESLPPASAVQPSAIPAETPAQSPTGAAPAAPRGDVRAWIVAAYGTAILVMVAWTLLGLAAVARLMRSTRPAPPECRILLRSLGGPASDRVAIVVSPRVMQPCALWWRSTTIVLPESLVDQSDPQQLRYALAHEWSHVEHGDLIAWNLSALARSLYFYQPLMWWLRRQLQLCQDYVADAAAARYGEMPEDYAEFLTTSSFTRPTLAAGLGIGGRISDLQRRVVMLVERRRPLESKSPRLWNLLGLPIAIALVALIAALAPQNRLEAGGGRLEEEGQGAAAEPADEALPAAEPVKAVEPATPADEALQPDVIEPAAAATPADEALPVVPRESIKEQTPATKPPGTPAPAKPQRKLLPGVIDPAMIEQKLNMHPVVAELSKQLTQAEWARAKEGGATLAVDWNTPDAKKRAAKVELLKELLEAYKDEIRPQVALELAQSAVQLATIEHLPTEIVETVIENGKPVERRRVVMQAVQKAKAPARPRKIKPGDTLMLSVQDNFQSLNQPGLQLLIPSGEALEVDEEGNISFGSAYGNIKVAGETLGAAEKRISQELLQRVQFNLQVNAATSQEINDRREQLSRQIQINVRLRYINPPVAQVYSPIPQQGATYPPATAPTQRITPVPFTRPVAGAPTYTAVAGTLQLPAVTAPSDYSLIKPGDLLSVELIPEDANKLVKRLSVVEPDGKLALGVTFGRVHVAGKSLSDAETLVKEVVAKVYRDPQVQITHADATNVPPGFGLPIIPSDDEATKKLQQEIDQLKATIRDLKKQSPSYEIPPPPQQPTSQPPRQKSPVQQ